MWYIYMQHVFDWVNINYAASIHIDKVVTLLRLCTVKWNMYIKKNNSMPQQYYTPIHEPHETRLVKVLFNSLKYM